MPLSFHLGCLAFQTVFHLFPIVSRRLADQTFKYHTHIFRMFKARKFGDSLKRKISLGQQLFYALDLYSPNFRLGRALQMLAKPAFQIAPRGLSMSHYVSNGATMKRLLADESDGSGDDWILN